jgi:hypothetical protein
MKTKGQTATEYLIILAVVIIIALIVVGVMGGIPGIGSGAKSQASSAYWRTAEIAITSSSVNPAGTTLNLRNNNPNTVRINSMTLGGNVLTTVPALPITMTAGQTQQLISTNQTCASGAFSYPVSISYTVTDTGATYVFTGTGQTLDGTCAN